MNKYQEALDYLAVSLQVFDETVDDKTYRDELEAKRENARKELQELVDKATPKKPIQKAAGRKVCPNCERSTVREVSPRYCSICGQAIDWGTDDL
jgi:hypothetical protein|nr:MAG TPA: ribosome, girodazole, girolline, antibiotic complex, 50S [Caudoviricetes sp.]